MIGKASRASSLSVVRMVKGAFDGERRGDPQKSLITFIVHLTTLSVVLTIQCRMADW